MNPRNANGRTVVSSNFGSKPIVFRREGESWFGLVGALFNVATYDDSNGCAFTARMYPRGSSHKRWEVAAVIGGTVI